MRFCEISEVTFKDWLISKNLSPYEPDTHIGLNWQLWLRYKEDLYYVSLWQRKYGHYERFL